MHLGDYFHLKCRLTSSIGASYIFQGFVPSHISSGSPLKVVHAERMLNGMESRFVLLMNSLSEIALKVNQCIFLKPINQQ